MRISTKVIILQFNLTLDNPNQIPNLSGNQLQNLKTLVSLADQSKNPGNKNSQSNNIFNILQQISSTVPNPSKDSNTVADTNSKDPRKKKK